MDREAEAGGAGFASVLLSVGGGVPCLSTGAQGAMPLHLLQTPTAPAVHKSQDRHSQPLQIDFPPAFTVGAPTICTPTLTGHPTCTAPPAPPAGFSPMTSISAPICDWAVGFTAEHLPGVLRDVPVAVPVEIWPLLWSVPPPTPEHSQEQCTVPHEQCPQPLAGCLPNSCPQPPLWVPSQAAPPLAPVGHLCLFLSSASWTWEQRGSSPTMGLSATHAHSTVDPSSLRPGPWPHSVQAGPPQCCRPATEEGRSH